MRKVLPGFLKFTGTGNNTLGRLEKCEPGRPYYLISHAWIPPCPQTYHQFNLNYYTILAQLRLYLRDLDKTPPLGLPRECKKFEITQSYSKNRLHENNWYLLRQNSFYMTKYTWQLKKSCISISRSMQRDYWHDLIQSQKLQRTCSYGKRREEETWCKTKTALMDTIYCGF